MRYSQQVQEMDSLTPEKEQIIKSAEKVPKKIPKNGDNERGQTNLKKVASFGNKKYCHG